MVGLWNLFIAFSALALAARPPSLGIRDHCFHVDRSVEIEEKMCYSTVARNGLKKQRGAVALMTAPFNVLSSVRPSERGIVLTISMGNAEIESKRSMPITGKYFMAFSFPAIQQRFHERPRRRSRF